MTNKELYFQAEKKRKRSKTNIRQRYDEMCYWILSDTVLLVKIKWGNLIQSASQKRKKNQIRLKIYEIMTKVTENRKKLLSTWGKGHKNQNSVIKESIELNHAMNQKENKSLVLIGLSTNNRYFVSRTIKMHDITKLNHLSLVISSSS